MLKTNIESLLDDIVFDILVRLPAQDIYNAVRLVCRKWYQMIHTHNFIHAHLQQSTCGLLIQNLSYEGRNLPVVTMQKGRIEISKFSYKMERAFWSSCNGLILGFNENYKGLYITNPATNQHFALPPIFTNTIYYYSHGHALAYAATSMEYKVVHTFYVNSSKSRDCAILTVGVDKDWRRRVNIEHLSLMAKKRLLMRSPLTTEGFVHWAPYGGLGVVKGEESDYVLTLNVETEIITQIPVPSLCHDGEILRYYYLSAGSLLSLLIAYTEFSWEVWEMKPETGEWTKLPNIDLEAQKSTFEPLGSSNCKLMPVGWLKFQEVLAFCVWTRLFLNIPVPTGSCIAYNVHTHEIDSCELDSDFNRFLVHRNSLVWLDGC